MYGARRLRDSMRANPLTHRPRTHYHLGMPIARESRPLRRTLTIAVAAIAFGACHRAPSAGSTLASPAATRALLLDPANAEFTRPAPPVSRLRFETSKGAFVLELHRDWGPLGADRLYNLARLGYFTDTRFHRVRAAYIAQWGLHGDSAVNAAWKGRYLRDDPPRSRNTRGTFAFSYEGPGREQTRNTQIYVNLADNPKNDAEPFTVLGTVVEGMAVLDSLYSGYGEDSGSGVRQGKQGPLERGGNTYMDREFPKLDRVFRVVISTP